MAYLYIDKHLRELTRKDPENLLAEMTVESLISQNQETNEKEQEAVSNNEENISIDQKDD